METNTLILQVEAAIVKIPGLDPDPATALAQTYPGFATALYAARDRLNAANTRPPDMTAVSQLVEAMRQLLAELEHIAADPTPQIVKDAIALFGRLTGDLKQFVPALAGQFLDLLQRNAVDQLRGLLCDPNAPIFGLAVFGPAFDKACSALSPGDPDPIGNFVKIFRDSLQAEAEDVEDNLKQTYDDLIALESDPVKKDDLRRQYKAELDQVKAQALQAGEAMLFDLLGRPLILFLMEANDIRVGLKKGNLTATGEKVLSLVGRLFDVADTLALAPAIQTALTIAGDLQNTCKQTSDFLSAAVTALGFPEADKIKSQAQALQGLFGRLTALEQSLRRDITKLPAADQQQAGVILDTIGRARIACASGVERLAKTLVDALDARDRAKQNADNLCSLANLNVRQLSFAAVQQLFALRLRAMREIGDLFAKLSGALDPAATKSSNPQPAARLLAAAPPPPSTPASLDGVTKEFGDIVSTFGATIADLLNDIGRIAARANDGASDPSLKAWFDNGKKLVVAVQAKAGDLKRFGDDLSGRLDQVKKTGNDLASAWQTEATSNWPNPFTIEVAASKARRLGALAVNTGILSQDQERQFLGAVASTLTLIGKDETAVLAAIDNVENAIGKVVAPILVPIISLHDQAVQILTDIQAQLSKIPDGLGGLALFLQIDLPAITELFDPGPIAADAGKLKTAQASFKAAEGTPATPTQPATPPSPKLLLSGLATLKDLRNDWNKKGGPALVLTGRKIEAAANKLLHGQLSDFISVGAIKQQIEDALIDLIPARYDLNYDFNTHVGDIGELFQIDREETDDSDIDEEHDLVISANLWVNLLKPSEHGVSIRGVLQPFKVKLLPVLDAVTLSFAPVTFTSKDGEKAKLDVKVSGVEIGPAMEFLKPLAEFLSPGGKNGFFIKPTISPPGLEAGFGLDLGTISIGTVSFMNVSINASVELPFDDSPAHFVVSLSRRTAPFIISAAPYGGGGFFALIATTKGVVGFEAAFEFGGAAAFSYGPLDAEGRITLGVYVSKNELSAQIGGYFFAGGSARIACFAVSASLLVTIIQTIGGSMDGEATFTFSFSCGLCDFDYSVGVAHSVGNGFSSGASGSESSMLIEEDGPVIELAVHEFSSTDFSAQSRRRMGKPATRRDTKCMSRNWPEYRSYFDSNL